MNGSGPQPNLLDHLEGEPPAGAPWWGKLLIGMFALAVASGCVYTFRLFSTVSKAFSAADPQASFPLLRQLQQLVAPPDEPLRGQERDRINVLLLGMGGEGHDGALLTDTIIIASMQPSTNKVGLLSLPRDLVVDIPGYFYRKINGANALGEEKEKPGSGALLTSSIIEKVIGQPVDYFVRVDFSGFAKLIDDIGGIDVTVDQAFVDSAYPTENYGYQTIRFAAGPQHMDGATALKYVRSRHGSNGEGSDFARSKRQQKVLVAVKEKLFSLQTLLNPAAISRAVATLGEHVQMNFRPWELLQLAKMGKTVDAASITHRVLDTSEEGLLVSRTGIDGAYILEPRLGLGKYAEIQLAFTNLLSEQTAVVAESPAVIELQNGTPIPGLAAKTAAFLKDRNVEVKRIGNAQERTATKTVIYDVHGNGKRAALAALKEALQADVATTLPAFAPSAGQGLAASDLGSSLSNASTLKNLQSNNRYADVDFVVIIGTDQVERQRSVSTSAESETL